MILNPFQYAVDTPGSDTNDKAGDSDCSVELKSVSKARNAQPTGTRAKLGTRVVKPKPIKLRKNSGGKSTFTVESVMMAFTDKTEFGISFRGMNADQQKSARLYRPKGCHVEE